jgi:hypothetical protein
MRIASTNTQLDSMTSIRKPAPSCGGQLEVSFETRSIAIGQCVPLRTPGRPCFSSLELCKQFVWLSFFDNGQRRLFLPISCLDDFLVFEFSELLARI